MLIILASSISLAIADPVEDTNIRNVVLDKIDYGFTAIFALEMILKVLINVSITFNIYNGLMNMHLK
jgi:voltage-dependent calcium channel N type alpha-1B